MSELVCKHLRNHGVEGGGNGLGALRGAVWLRSEIMRSPFNPCEFVTTMLYFESPTSVPHTVKSRVEARVALPLPGLAGGYGCRDCKKKHSVSTEKSPRSRGLQLVSSPVF